MKLFLILLIAFLTTSCSFNKQPYQQNESEQPVITVTIEPLRYFTEAIAGDKFKIVSMVPKGNSPENYDPTPRQLIDLSQSKAYFRIGHIGFEKTWMERLSDNVPHLQFFDMSRGIEFIYDETHHEGVEPHIWTSPANACIIATNIFNALCALDKEHKSEFTIRYDSLMHQLHQTDSLITEKLKHSEAGKAFMIYHPALSYFARDYHLQQIPIEIDGKEPSPAQLQEIIKGSLKKQVNIIFIQPEFDRRNAELIANQVGASVIEINPLSYDWKKEMLNIAHALTHKSNH